MLYTPFHAAWIIGVAGVITFGSRILPFLFFREGKTPKTVLFLGNVLPAAMMALLIVYSLKDTDVFSVPYGFPEAIAVLSVISLHLWRRNTLLSIFGGTLIYMMLVQTII